MNAGLMDIVKDPIGCIVQGTRYDPFTLQIGVLLGPRPTTAFLHDIGNDYIDYIRQHKPDEFKECIKYMFGEEGLELLRKDPNATIDFTIDKRHPLWYYDFLHQLPAWKKLHAILSPTQIISQISLTDPTRDGCHDLYIALSSEKQPLVNTARQQIGKTAAHQQARKSGNAPEAPENIPS